MQLQQFFKNKQIHFVKSLGLQYHSISNYYFHNPLNRKADARRLDPPFQDLDLERK